MRASWLVVVLLVAGAGWGLEFAGQVVGPDGAPRAGVEVLLAPWVQGEAEPAAPLAAVTTDAAGRFVYAHPGPLRSLVAMVRSDEGLGFRGWPYTPLAGEVRPPVDEATGDPRPVTVRLRPWVSVGGLVTDSAGQPLAGATVTVAEFNTVQQYAGAAGRGLPVPDDLDLEPLVADGFERTAWPAAWPALSATTGADGRWQLPRSPAQGIACRVTLPGWTSGSATVWPLASEATAPTQLERVAGLRGRLVDAAGQPLAGHRLGVGHLGRREWTPTVTEADGRFAWSDLAPSSVDVRSLEWLSDQQLPATAYTLTAGETLDLGDVAAQPTRPLVIRFRDGETGEPVAGVGLQGALGGADLRSEDVPRSGPDGVVTLPVPPTAPHAQFASLTPVLPPGWLPSWDDALASLEIADQGDLPPMEVTVHRAHGVTGRVVDEAGAPQGGVYLGLWHTEAIDDITARTDAGGRFSLANLYPAGDYDLIVYETLGPSAAAPEGPYGNVARLSQTVGAAALPATGWEIVVPTMPRTTLRGRVVDDDGAPVAGAALRLSATAPGEFLGAAADLETAADGTFTAVDVPAQLVYQVEASARGYRPHARRNLPPGETVFEDLRLAALDQAVTGRVVDEAGAPVAGARVVSAALPAVGTTTDATGEFRLAGLPRGPLTLRVGDEQRSVATVAATGGGPPLTVTLRPLAPLDPDRGRDAAATLLHDAWAATTDPDLRLPILRALTPLEPDSALRMLAFQPAEERAWALVDVWPRVAFEAPLLALQAVGIVDALGPERAARARLMLAVGLLEAGHTRHAAALAADTPVAADASAVSQALAALVRVRLGQEAADDRWAAAAARLADGEAGGGPSPLVAPLASLVGDPALLAALVPAGGLAEEVEVNFLLGLAAAQPERAAELALDATVVTQPPTRPVPCEEWLVAGAILRALPAAARLPWVDRLPAAVAADLRPAAILLNGDPATIATLADQTLPEALLPIAAQIAPEVVARTLHQRRYSYDAQEIEVYLRPAQAWLRRWAEVDDVDPGIETDLKISLRAHWLPDLAELDLDGALAVLADIQREVGVTDTATEIAELLTDTPLDRAWRAWADGAAHLAAARAALVAEAAEEEPPPPPPPPRG